MDGDNKKNLVLAIALSAVIMIGWQFFFAIPEHEAQVAQQQASQQAQTGAGDSAHPKIGGEVPADRLTGAETPKSRDEVLEGTPRLTINTPKLAGTIALKGARIDDLTLRDYHETIDEGSPNIVLLHPVGTEKPYHVEFGWLGQSGDVPNRNTVWEADKQTVTVGDPVTLSWTNDAGARFEQVITLDKNYMFTITQRVVNEAGEPLTVSPYGVISRTGTPKILGYYILHEGPVGFLDGSLKEPKYDDLIDDGAVQPAQKVATTGGWLGITDKYWLAALIPDQTETVQTSFTGDRTNGRDRYQADFLTEAKTVAPGQTVEMTNRLFAGAKETTLLDSYRDKLGIVNFDLAVDFGWFYWLTKPIFYGIHFLHGFLGNFGLAILGLTLFIKLCFFPLANKSYRSMSKMKLLQPKMQEMKEKYGDDRQKLNTEMMELYKKEKVNPLSGCLPIMLQIPVFFSLYKVLFVTIEMRHAPFFGWIHDLSAPDPLGLLTVFGMVPWDVPTGLHIVNIGVWPVIMGITMFLQQKLNPAPADPIQAKVFMFMPLMFTFILGGFPAGLVIYWAWNNSLSILQQYVIMRRMGVAIGGGKAKS